MANRNYPQSKLFQFEIMPVLLSCNFVVDSTNGNGLGIRNLKGSGISQVYMHTTASPLAGNPNPTAGVIVVQFSDQYSRYLSGFSGQVMGVGSSSNTPTGIGSPEVITSLGTNNGPAGTPASFALARVYSALGSTAVSNNGLSTLSGNLGVAPSSVLSGFPPGVVDGRVDPGNALAIAAQSAASTTYTALQALTPTIIPAALDGQTLVPGTYASSGGAFTLAASAEGTLTLNGTGVYVFQMSSTLMTGAGGPPIIRLENGARSSDIYWVLAGAATINSAFPGIFRGNVLAQGNVAVTMGGETHGSLVSLAGMVDLGQATAAFFEPLLVGTSLQQWQLAGLPVGVVPAVGAAFISSTASAIGGNGTVAAPAASGIDHIEVIGDPNQTIISPIKLQTTQPVGSITGGEILLQCLLNTSATAPANGTVIGLNFYLSNSSVVLAGQ
jgi:hypothetical protein